LYQIIEELIRFFSSVDLVETGDTMRAAGLEVVADILETEVQFTSLIYNFTRIWDHVY